MRDDRKRALREKRRGRNREAKRQKEKKLKERERHRQLRGNTKTRLGERIGEIEEQGKRE